MFLQRSSPKRRPCPARRHAWCSEAMGCRAPDNGTDIARDFSVWASIIAGSRMQSPVHGIEIWDLVHPVLWAFENWTNFLGHPKFMVVMIRIPKALLT
jgi:hypothetical protein